MLSKATPFANLRLIKAFSPKIKRRSFLGRVALEEFGCRVDEISTVNAYCRWLQKMGASSEVRVTRDGQLRIKSNVTEVRDGL